MSERPRADRGAVPTMTAARRRGLRGFAAIRTKTVRDELLTAYARMIYHTLLRQGRNQQTCAAIGMTVRRRLLNSGEAPRAIGVREERVKIAGECVYCGGQATSVDHLIPQFKNGPDTADNLVPSCRGCNSSKGSRDVFVWAASKGFFPVHLVRRYLVLAWQWCERVGLLEKETAVLIASITPFSIDTINWSRELPTIRISHSRDSVALAIIGG